MWPFKKRKIENSETRIVKVTDDPSISCLVKGVGVMIESKDYEWENRSNIFSSYFECKSENISILLDYNIFTKEYKASSLIFSSQGGLKNQENIYLIAKLVNRFPDTVIQKRKDEEDKEQRKLDRISKLGCPQKT